MKTCFDGVYPGATTASAHNSALRKRQTVAGTRQPDRETERRADLAHERTDSCTIVTPQPSGSYRS